MSRSQIDGIGLLVAAAGAVLILRLVSQGPLDWLGSISGLALVFVLLSFDREGYRSAFESLAFAAVFGLCVTTASTAVLRALGGSLAQPAPLEGRIGSEWMPLIWVLVTIIFWPIDRARMSGRVASTAFPPTPGVFRLTPPPPPPEAVRSVAQEPPPTPAAPVRISRAAFTEPTFSQPEPEAIIPSVPAPHAPVFTPPVAAPQPLSPPEPLTAPAAPPPQAVQIPSGKETTIYLNLVGEGMNMLRAVRAEHLGRDYYKIIEEMPEGETWQFGPGQVVRCKKKNLSSGKAMVAYEEAPRAQ